MKVAILGYDTEGRVSYQYFSALGHEITICDQNPEIDVPDGVASLLGDNYLEGLDRFDLLVRTPGLPPARILEKNPGVAGKITTQLNEFMAVCPTKNIIGVTGTKGKGTTSTLITKMLEASGKQVVLGGNIGIPFLSLLDQLDEQSWVVLELSSFQLIDLKASPHIAVCLMVVPEHLDWHVDSDEYIIAKSQLFSHQKPDDIAVYYALNETSKRIASMSPGWKTPYMEFPGATVTDGNIVVDQQVICSTSDLKLPGEHNWQNVCAAVTAVWKVSQDVEAIRSVLTSFTSLEHRLELVRELNGVRWYNDSYGTTPETAIVAIQAFDQPKIAILGGSDKGADYNQLAKTIAENDMRKVLLIGEQAPRIQADLQKVGFDNFENGGSDIAEIVSKANALAQPGDVVLLSPACASFDMFKNYKDRGLQYKKAVEALDLAD